MSIGAGAARERAPVKRRPTIARAIGPSRGDANMTPVPKRPTPKPPLPILECADDAHWQRWLQDNHASSPGVWLKFAKQAADASTVNHAQALDTAICFGWIDGQVRRFDESFWLQRFTPRGPRSRWSQINCAKAEQLIIDERMHAAGLAEVQAARADGR